MVVVRSNCNRMGVEQRPNRSRIIVVTTALLVRFPVGRQARVRVRLIRFRSVNRPLISSLAARVCTECGWSDRPGWRWYGSPVGRCVGLAVDVTRLIYSNRRRPIDVRHIRATFNLPLSLSPPPPPQSLRVRCCISLPMISVERY